MRIRSSYDEELILAHELLTVFGEFSEKVNKGLAITRLGNHLSSATHRKEFQTSYISKNAIKTKAKKRCREHAFGITRVAEMMIESYLSGKIKGVADIDRFLKRHAFQNHTTTKENRRLVVIYNENPNISWIDAYKLAGIVLYEGRGSGVGRSVAKYAHIPYNKLKKYPLI
jgi:hypothetical protein